MKVHELAFYSKFNCLGKDCPYTCCQGWKIIYDEDSLNHIKQLPFKERLPIQRGLTKKDGMTLIKLKKQLCPFLTANKTCGIQEQYGKAYMPDICEIFPRLRTNYHYFAEEALSLSCPNVVRLFLSSLEDLSYHEVERDVSYAFTNTNKDENVLRHLLKVRKEICQVINDSGSSRAVIGANLLSYTDLLQKEYISFAMSDTKDFSFTTLNKAWDADMSPFSFSVAQTDAMISHGFYHTILKKNANFLYRLCLLYYRTFDTLTFAEADEKMEELIKKLHLSHPEMEQILRGNLIYILQTRFLETYENYSFLRYIRLGLLHTHLLELFLALYFDKHDSLTYDELVLIISAYHRRGFHNPIVEQGMYEAVFS